MSRKNDCLSPFVYKNILFESKIIGLSRFQWCFFPLRLTKRKKCAILLLIQATERRRPVKFYGGFSNEEKNFAHMAFLRGTSARMPNGVDRSGRLQEPPRKTRPAQARATVHRPKLPQRPPVSPIRPKVLSSPRLATTIRATLSARTAASA